MPRMGRNCRGMRFACPGASGKETRITRMVTNLMTVESIGFGQFVVRERSRWDRRHRRQSRDGKRRASREASEFQIRVALPMSEGFAPEAYRLSLGSDADQGYIKSGGEHTAHRRSRKR